MRFAPSFPQAVTDTMADREDLKLFSIWVNWDKRVISFHKVVGFEELQFPTYEDKFKFVTERGYEGFGIQ